MKVPIIPVIPAENVFLSSLRPSGITRIKGFKDCSEDEFVRRLRFMLRVEVNTKVSESVNPLIRAILLGFHEDGKGRL